VCAIPEGRSVDTTMGFTPLDGLVMATRCGAIDSGLVLCLLEHAGIEPGALTHALGYDSGLQAPAGTADMRGVIAGAEGGEPRVRLALQVYLRALRGRSAGWRRRSAGSTRSASPEESVTTHPTGRSGRRGQRCGCCDCGRARTWRWRVRRESF
jgi:hypothetical protein